jgi:hypothetical protein
MGVIAAEEPTLLSIDEISTLLETVRGGDNRIVRWDAKSKTVLAIEQGACEALPTALLTILHRGGSTNDDGSDASNTQLVGMACEYATFCITDNPDNRNVLARLGQEHAILHKRIVELIASKDSYTAAMAAHLIYIASFNNAINHKLFFKANAVAVLCKIITEFATSMNKQQQSPPPSPSSQPSRPHVVMWTAAALQNLAASYCDGRCPWIWDSAEADHVQVDSSYLPVTSPGDTVRRTVLLRHEAVIQQLLEMACHYGPVQGTFSDVDNIFPGHNGIIHRDEDSFNLIAWAATGALKNLALEQDINDRLDVVLQESPVLMACICHMSHSPDWLESNKGKGLLHHVRRFDPCWFQETVDKHGKNVSGALKCIDMDFFDNDGFSCGDYEHATNEECKLTDHVNKSLTAEEACCGCSGGIRINEEAQDAQDSAKVEL